MQEEEVYSKPEGTIVKPKKSHKKLIILSAVSILAICLIFAYYFIYIHQSDLVKTREEIMTHMDGIINTIEKTNSNYTESEVSYALENPRNFNSSVLFGYTSVSSSYSMKNSFVILKGIFENQFSKGFNDVDAISAPTYLILLIASMGLSYTVESNFVSACEVQVNFTEDDKKECIISVLDAEKNVLDHYYSLDYSGNVENCVDTLKGNSFIGGKEYPALGDSKLNQICQNMIGYRKQLLEEVKNASIDYNQKYCIVSSLYLQDLYIGSGNESLNEILKEGMKDSIYLKIFP